MEAVLMEVANFSQCIESFENDSSKSNKVDSEVGNCDILFTVSELFLPKMADTIISFTDGPEYTFVFYS